VDTLRRELKEELDLMVDAPRQLTQFAFDLAPMGLPRIYREYFEVRLAAESLLSLKLGEGKAFEAFTREQVLALPRVTPYDAFALWLYANQFRLQS